MCVCHIDSIFPSCKSFIRLCVEAPFLVRTSLSCSCLLIQWIDISFLPRISRKAAVFSFDVVRAVLGPVISTLTYCTPCLNSVFVKWVTSSF